MKFIYFTDIHLGQGYDSYAGFERCLESMLHHAPQVLVNGGDLGMTPAAVTRYKEMVHDVSVPIFHSNGNHEICSGYVPREQAGTCNRSVDLDGVHFIFLDVVRYFEPTPEHTQNWHVLADTAMLEWLAEDLRSIDRQTPLVVASHVPLSTSFPFRMGQEMGMAFPTNEVENADRVLALLKPFAHVATLHGHDHENCHHFFEHIEIMTSAAVAGTWWKEGLQTRGSFGEPLGYRLVEIDAAANITSRFINFLPAQDEPAELFLHQPSGRRFVNVFDASPKTQVAAADLGILEPLNPWLEESCGLSTHFYELPINFDRQGLDTIITFADGRVETLTLEYKVIA